MQKHLSNWEETIQNIKHLLQENDFIKDKHNTPLQSYNININTNTFLRHIEDKTIIEVKRGNMKYYLIHIISFLMIKFIFFFFPSTNEVIPIQTTLAIVKRSATKNNIFQFNIPLQNEQTTFVPYTFCHFVICSW